MKFLMRNWHSRDKRLPAWFKEDEEIDLTMEQLQELYNTGLNIMLYHYDKGNVLFVDSRRFSQR